MRVVLNNSFIRINNALTKIGDTVTQFVEPLGQIFRIVNSGNITSAQFEYTDINGELVSTIFLNPGEVGYILAQSGSLTDTEVSVDGNFTVTNLFITSSVDESPNFTEVLLTIADTSPWVKPEGVTQVIAECWGGGGAGGGSTTNGTGGGGGAGGDYSRGLYVFSSTSESILFFVGQGGVGSTGIGTDGGATSFDRIPLTTRIGNQAGGGRGGGNGTNENINTAGIGSASTTYAVTEFSSNPIDGVTYRGGNGQAGYGAFQIDSGGGGGGGAGSSKIGNDAVDNGIGGGLSTREFGGAGGVGNDGTTSTNGSPGSNYGGGGSGAYKVSGANRSGGDGAPGAIRIIYR